MENYNKVKKHAEKYNCKLITAFEDFEKNRETVLKQSYHFIRINFIGTCGHNSSAIVTNFIRRNTGVRCKDCVKLETKSTLQSKNKLTNVTETKSINTIVSYITPEYEVIRTKEGCAADLAIRNMDINENYMAIQVKSTTQLCHGMYSFKGIKSTYQNMLIICVCISENKVWIIPYNDLKVKSDINISLKSKYNKYLVENNEVMYTYINKYTSEYQNNTLEILLQPITNLQQREQDYIKKREEYVNCIQYNYPEVQNTPTDFMVNGKKVQEKVCTTHKRDNKYNLFNVWFSSNNGKKDNKTRKFRTYCLGENDYYWLHSDIDDRFWIIPESILYEKEFISNKNEIKNRKCMNLNSNVEWLINYEYNYTSVNRDKIIKLFE